MSLSLLNYNALNISSGPTIVNAQLGPKSCIWIQPICNHLHIFLLSILFNFNLFLFLFDQQFVISHDSITFLALMFLVLTFGMIRIEWAFRSCCFIRNLLLKLILFLTTSLKLRLFLFNLYIWRPTRCIRLKSRGLLF